MPAIILDHVKHRALLEALGLEFEPAAGATIIYGEANIGANVGDGTGQVYRDKTDVTLNFRTLKTDPAAPGITITTDGDVIKLGTVAGTGNVVGTPPSVADGVATYDGTTGLLIDGPDTKIMTVSEALSETPPTARDAQYIKMRTSEGSDWAEVIRYAISAAGSFDNNIRLGPKVKLNGQESTITLSASQDPQVSLIGGTLGALIWEGITAAWEIRKQGEISQEDGANTPILTLSNKDATTYTLVAIKAGNVLPNGVVDGKNGDRYYFKDRATAANSAEYIFQNLTPGNNSWVKMGAGGGVTAHSALTGLTTGDDHTQYALLAGRSGGQKIVGGTADGDDLRFQSTTGDGVAGNSEISFKVGNNGDVTAMVIDKNGDVGVGTPTPDEKLGVDGRVAISEGSDTYLKLGGRMTKALYDALGTNCRIVATRSGDTYPFDTFGNLVIGSRAGVGDIVLTTSSSDYDQFVIDINGDIGMGIEAPDEKLHVIGSVKIEDGSGTLGKRWTDTDDSGKGEWLAGVAPTQSRSSTIILDEDDERVTITDGPITVTVPAAPKHGKSYRVMNANGVANGAGNAANVVLDIFGSTVEFNGGNSVGNTLTLANDGDWAYIWFDEDFGDDGTWWVNSNVTNYTGDSA